jgi:hypothetical protein
MKTTLDDVIISVRTVSDLQVIDTGNTLAVAFEGASGQTVSLLLPLEASRQLCRDLTRAQVEATAFRAGRRIGDAP